MGTVLISNKSIQWGQLAPILDGPARIRLSPEAKQSIRKSHKILRSLLDNNQQIYGVNTGFGQLSTVPISQGRSSKASIEFGSFTCMRGRKALRFGCDAYYHDLETHDLGKRI